MGTTKTELPLTNRRIEIPQEPLPTTEAARKLDEAERKRTHKVFRIYDPKRYNQSKPGSSPS